MGLERLGLTSLKLGEELRGVPSLAVYLPKHANQQTQKSKDGAKK